MAGAAVLKWLLLLLLLLLQGGSLIHELISVKAYSQSGIMVLCAQDA